MAYTFDDDPEAFVRQAEIDAANTPEAQAMAQYDRAAAALDAAQAQTDAANARAAGMAARDPNVYNPDRPSTWGAPDSPKMTTLDRGRAVKPGAEATSMAQQARAEALGLTPDDGRASIQARSSAADRALAAQETPAEELAAMRAQGGRAQFNEAFDAAGRRIVSTRANPRYPSTAKYVGTMLGDGSVSQAVGPDGQPLFDTRVVDEPIVGADGQPMPDPMNPQGPPLMRKVEQRVPVMQRNDGLIGGERQAAIQMQEAELDREMTNTNLLAQQAMEQRRLHNDMLTTQMAQRQRAEAVRANVDQAYKGVQKATAEFAKASDIDPDRGWGEKGVGAKIAAVIASGLLGFAGRDPFAHINAVIENSIDAQKSNMAKKSAAADQARGQQAAAVSAYDQIRAQIGDEALADEAYRLSALETIRSQALAKLQNANVQVLDANQQAFMNGLDQQIAEKTRNLELVSATTPKTITTVRSPYTPEQRAMLKTMGTEGLKASAAGADKSIDIVAKRQEQGRDVEGKIAIEEAKNAAGGPLSDADSKLLMAHVDNTQKAGTLSDLINDFQKDYGDRDIPGRGISSATDIVFSPNERADANSRLSQIVDSIGRLQSGGAITSDEAERFQEWIDAGVGDARLLQNLKNIQQMANASVQRSERALPDRLRAQYRRTAESATASMHSDPFGATGRVNRQDGGAVVEDQ
jgi:hypothetical protein